MPAWRTDDATADDRRRARAALRRDAARCRPPDELIRFVVGAGRRLTPDLKRKLPGPRRLGDGARAGASTEAVKQEGLRPRLKAPVGGRRRTWPTRSSACWRGPPGTVSASPTRRARRLRLRQSRGGDRQRRRGGVLHASGRGPGRGQEDRAGAEETLRRKGGADSRPRRRSGFVRIGFGIGAVTCDTCSASWKAQRAAPPCALPGLGALPRRDAGDGAARVSQLT